MNETKRRIVQVFIADTDENVPLESSLLYSDEKPHMTDLDNQELYLGIGITEILSKHNAKRVTWLDKEATRKVGKDIFLEPAKIRELKMRVVEVATF